MRIEQVNIGQETPIKVGNRETVTGIFKKRVDGPVAVGELGLDGDAVCDGRHHGGPDQAVYLYALEDYVHWSQLLSRPVESGTFGENLTVSGIDLRSVCVGDVLRGDHLTLQVTAPRIPCNTLATRMGDKKFAKQFVSVARSGAYCRVLQTGPVSAGDVFEWESFDGDRISLTEFFDDCHRKLDAGTLNRYLAAPIDERTRKDFSGRLKKLA